MHSDPWLDDPDDYRGQSEVWIELTSPGQTSAQQRHSLLRWLEFLATPHPIERLSVESRVPQAAVDALVSQRQVRELHLKFGPLTDLTPLAALPRLADLSFGTATRLRDVSPLLAMPALERLNLSNPHPEVAIEPLSDLTSLKTLRFGNGYPGIDRSLTLPGVAWLTPLVGLERLELPGTRLLDPDLSPLLKLPRLRHLQLPLRRAYRKQVAELAAQSEPFAAVLHDYLGYEELVAALR